MSKSVIKAVFDRDFHWSRPGARFGFGARAGADAQKFPRDFIAAAIAAGAARPVTTKQAPTRA